MSEIAPSVPEELVAQVRERYDRFQQSSRTIGNFVSDTEQSVAGIIQRNADILHRLQDSEPADESPDEDDAAAVLLGEEEAQYLAKLLADHSRTLQQYPHILFEMAFIYFVAAFEAYMQDVIELTLRYRPEILKSSKQLAVDRVIDLVQAGTLIAFLAEREVGELGYRSFRDQAEYYREKFNLEIAATADMDELVEYHARRNLLVHNSGVVNRRYLEAVSGAQSSLGSRLEITSEYWAEAQRTFTRVATHVRDHLVRKFGPKRRSGA